MARRSNRVNGKDDSKDEHSNSGSDSPSTDDTIAFTAVRRKKRGRGRPKRSTKRQRNRVNSDQQNDSDDDGSPQPSTSGISMQLARVNGTQNGSDRESSDSGEESPDSDNMPVDDNRDFSTKVSSTTTQPTAKKRAGTQQATRCSPRTKKKRPNYAVNGVKDSSRGGRRLSSMFQNLDLSNNKSTKGSQPKDAFDSKVVESSAQKCVYFLLVEDQKKHAIKRKAIVQNVFKNEVYTPKLYTAVIHKANLILKKTFGMELMELENQKDSYLIINILKREYGVEDYVELPRIKHQQHGLILYLLTIIFMNDNCITEGELVKALKSLRLDFFSKKPHPVFGDIKKYITVELVKQMYLNYECINKDPPQYEITWGLRAKEEIDKMDLLQFACKIMDDTSPENWILQYKDAEESASPE